MNSSKIVITSQLAHHCASVEKLGADAFGPGRFARTAFRLREGVAAEPDLCFVALDDDQVVGSVQMTRVMIGNNTGLVLGPLVVAPDYKQSGIGSELMTMAVDASRNKGWELIVLVGDEPYYKPFGFKVVDYGRLQMPGPVDPARFLYCELKSGAYSKFSGAVKPCRL